MEDHTLLERCPYMLPFLCFSGVSVLKNECSIISALRSGHFFNYYLSFQTVKDHSLLSPAAKGCEFMERSLLN